MKYDTVVGMIVGRNSMQLSGKPGFRENDYAQESQLCMNEYAMKKDMETCWMYSRTLPDSQRLMDTAGQISPIPMLQQWYL